MTSSQIFGQMVVVSLVKISKSRNSEVPKHDLQDHYIAVLGDITATAPVELPSRWNPPRAILFAKPGQARSSESEYRGGRWISSLSSKSCSTSQRRRPRHRPAMTETIRSTRNRRDVLPEVAPSPAGCQRMQALHSQCYLLFRPCLSLPRWFRPRLSLSQWYGPEFWDELT
jgi:hypothetical protein